jgi:ferredoxin
VFPKSISELFKKFFLKEGVVYQEISVDGPFHFLLSHDSVLIGEYPRRVSIGEILYTTNSHKTLSPVEGLAYSKPENNLLQIYVDGALASIPNRDKNEFSQLAELTERIDELALPSIDFKVPLKEYFDRFQNKTPKGIVFSPFTRNNTLDYHSLILKEFGDDLGEFISLFNKLFPSIPIYDFVQNRPNFSFQHPFGIPEFFIRKFVMGGQYSRSKKEEDDYIYFGAETLYHFLKGYFFGIPFTRRMCIVHLFSRSGNLSRQKYVFNLMNGQSLNFISSKFKEKFKFFSFDYIYDEPKFEEFNKKYYYDIEKHSDIVLYPKGPSTQIEFPCTGCLECNYFCPTHANPFSLVFDNANNFKLDSCIECGICSVYCPSGIDLKKKIEKLNI